MEEPKITARETVAAGKFLALDVLRYRDDRGRERRWEAATRVNSRGAVMIVAALEPDDALVLVRQFRPPAGKYLIEFPAGLIDPGENPETAAVRELSEETGYEGEVLRVLPGAYNSPGLSGETITTVLMKIDGERYRRTPPAPHPEETESITVSVVSRSGLRAFLEAAWRRGDGVDAKVLAYAMR